MIENPDDTTTTEFSENTDDAIGEGSFDNDIHMMQVDYNVKSAYDAAKRTVTVNLFLVSLFNGV